jgi:hypothetical protein
MESTPPNPGDILDCVVTHREDGGLWVQSGEWIGFIDNCSIAWVPEDSPALGERVRVVVKFLTPVAEVPYDFVGSIKNAYPKRHPINWIDDSIIGTRFRSKTRPLGQWIVFFHPTGLLGVLPREALEGRAIGHEDLVEAEVIAVDRNTRRLMLRLPLSCQG